MVQSFISQIIAATIVGSIQFGQPNHVITLDKAEVDEVTFASTKAVTFVVILPEPISRAELGAYTTRLDLSAEQIKAADSLYAEYLELCREVKKREVDPLWNDVAKIQRDSAGFAAEFENVMKARERIERSLVSVDAILFTKLNSITSSEQAGRMPMIQLDRTRQIYGPPVFREPCYPEGRIDLIELVRELRIPIDDSPELQKVLDEYCSTLAQTLKEVSRRNVDAAVKDQYLVQLMRTSAAQERAEVSKRRSELLQDRLAEARRLREINLRFLPRILACALPADARRFRDKFLQRAFPTVYPDIADATAAIEMILDIPTLSDEQRVAIGALVQQYQTRYRQVCKEMEECVTEWFERRFAQEIMQGDKEQFEQRLMLLKNERSLLRDRSLKSMTDVLTAAQVSALPAVEQGAGR